MINAYVFGVCPQLSIIRLGVTDTLRPRRSASSHYHDFHLSNIKHSFFGVHEVFKSGAKSTQTGVEKHKLSVKTEVFFHLGSERKL